MPRQGDLQVTTSDGRTQRRHWIAVVALSCAFETLLLTKPLDAVPLAVADDLLLTCAGLVGGSASLRRSGRESGRLRRGWLLIGLGCMVFAGAQLGFATLAGLGEPTPDTSIPALLGVASIPLAGWGLVAFSGASLTSRAVTALDGCTVAVSMLFVSWVTVLGPVYRASDDRGEQITTLFYVGGSLALTALVLAVMARWRGDLLTLSLLAVAFAWVSITNAAYGLESVRGTYVTGHALIDLGWFSPFLLVALAAERPSARRSPADVARRWFLTLAIPYVALLVPIAILVAVLVSGESLDRFLEACGGTLLVLLMTRMLLTFMGYHALTTDLERRVVERTEAARISDVRLRALLRNSSDVIAVLDAADRFAYASPAAASVLGQRPEDLRGQLLRELVHPDDRTNTSKCLQQARTSRPSPVTLACRLLRPDGQWCHVEASITVPVDDPDLVEPVLNIRDVSDRVALQEELRVQATYDPLTALGNRRLFHERVRHALDRTRRTDETLSVLFVDLDHFKRINDSSGHAVGDEVLVQVADRIRSCLRPADTAARLGGDEFAVLLEGTSAEQARQVTDRVLAALEPPYQLADRTLVVTASVGVTSAVGGTRDGDTLLRDADVAMYQAKAQGRGRYAVFEPAMHAELVEQMALESELREALGRHQLRIEYQPVLELKNGTVTGVEALLRWRSSEDNDVPASIFIPLAEERGIIQQLDAWVLHAACRQVRYWQLRFPEHAALRVSVNLSAVELRSPDLAARVERVLHDTGLAAESLVLDITETAVLPDAHTVRDALQELRELGVGIALDDFGTGHASLSALRGLPLDAIKVDQSFIAGMDNGHSGRRLVGAIVSMAQALDLETVAEAVETPNQLAWLRRMRCGAGQGHLFSPPLEVGDLTRALADGITGVATPRIGFRKPVEERRNAAGA
jgi:diguanylate cyclase (GGDEF)-like protein/PAS domain S-box-containing protein